LNVSAKMTSMSPVPLKKRRKHAIVAFLLSFVWLFVVMLLWSTEQPLTATLLKSLMVATAVALPVGVLAAFFGERVVAEVKAFIEHAGLC
jgi:uncharacterized membrane protein (DUF485 family)